MMVDVLYIVVSRCLRTRGNGREPTSEHRQYAKPGGSPHLPHNGLVCLREGVGADQFGHADLLLCRAWSALLAPVVDVPSAHAEVTR